ncbi:MAG: putative FAD-linked oxidoreductase [Spirochaetes bacterium ADurb.Bin218]|jgi:FAD/FMN-containing dehydrogenase/Fe-S oxidoreductase|nr:MAG: putative FAD-linked oxidoreductase [Spirochaetes bacterium ADurb.Bin218]
MKKEFGYREIPYNYTSFSDREIILKYFDEETWNLLDSLRAERKTGRSAKLIFEIIGDIFIIDRNPYIFNDILEYPKKLKRLKRLHQIRIDSIIDKTSNPKTVELVDRLRKVDRDFFQKFNTEKFKRKKILSLLSQVTSEKNIHFSAFHKVAHVTDATDWRVEYPEVVVYPENSSEIIGLVKAAKELGLKIIPRGGGTGLTGGAIPVYPNTMVINLEKLRNISEIEFVKSGDKTIPVVETEAGVITEEVTHYCKEQGYIFATDPTSAWASTIGGNIAENAGGKKCVMWGTAIDNIFSFKIVNSEGHLLEVVRRDHPHRKIEPDDEVIFDVYQLHRKREKNLLKTISLKGTEIRKSGVGKDITNKALKGVPGIQKEGGDGIIVSAKFVLYRPFKYCRTICLEFFGTNMINAAKAIVEIRDIFADDKLVYLTALEHFDDKYVAAINYRNKSNRTEFPKAVLLIDVESNDHDALEQGTEKILNIVKNYNTEGFLADTESKRELFWKDRKNLGAIARHTNAFKLNEDIVIPVEALPEFSDFIDNLNIQKELENNCQIIDEVVELLEEQKTDDDFFLSKIDSYIAHIKNIKDKQLFYIKNLESRAGDIVGSLDEKDRDKLLFEVLRDGAVEFSIADSVIERFKKNFHGYDEIINNFQELVDFRQSRKLIIATHMHAGDGNVHVNIPVHSNDYRMLLEADETAGIIMKATTDKFQGVISGEHGIGLTKLRFIDKSVLDDFAAYKKESDPSDLFNPGKLRHDFPHDIIYTPSLNLLELEAFILEVADMKELTKSISSCVRCGKCKEVCNTHYPEATMFYSPRNKILAVTLITEAVLYEAQTTNNLSFRNFRMLRDVSDHCTMCHNCYNPCPVNIDFGNVSLAIRSLLHERKRSEPKLITSFVLFYLKTRGYYYNKLFRYILLKAGYSMERLAYVVNKPLSAFTSQIAPKLNEILKSRLPRAGNPTLRELLGLKGANTFFAFTNPQKDIIKSVVYFPGCGSERMFPEISMAVIALLYNAGVRVVIPPEYLCCGYPLLANGRQKDAENKSYENRVIFHRMADIVNYMGISDVIVSCGTCYEMLSKYTIENIFQDAEITDINEFIATHLLYSKEENSTLYYHDPCHSPLKKMGADKTFKTILGTKPLVAPNCCGEGGTLALSTPHISNSLRNRKRKNIKELLTKRENITVLTTCPSCVQGLSRINGRTSVTGKSMVVYLAEKMLGTGWKKQLVNELKKQGVERIIL